LPKENWQILACLPQRKDANGIWRGINLTYYGFFNATACLFAVILFLLMAGSLGITFTGSLSVAIAVMAICMSASRFIARLVEKKQNTFSVGGASFVGILITPCIITLANITLGKQREFHMPVIETMAAMFIAYAFGEGIGRLACISFGCCYGRPLSACDPLIQRIFQRWNFVFWGKTKKIAYDHQLDGQAVIPIQALTAIIYSGCGLLSFYLFTKGKAPSALLITLFVTQGWRFVSEFLRADYRGHGHLSAYQIMAVLSIAYTLFLFFVLPVSGNRLPEIRLGLMSLWDPGLILFLGALWLFSFLYTGRSAATGAAIHFYIRKKEI